MRIFGVFDTQTKHLFATFFLTNLCTNQHINAHKTCIFGLKKEPTECRFKSSLIVIKVTCIRRNIGHRAFGNGNDKTADIVAGYLIGIR